MNGSAELEQHVDHEGCGQDCEHDESDGGGSISIRGHPATHVFELGSVVLGASDRIRRSSVFRTYRLGGNGDPVHSLDGTPHLVFDESLRALRSDLEGIVQSQIAASPQRVCVRCVALAPRCGNGRYVPRSAELHVVPRCLHTASRKGDLGEWFRVEREYHQRDAESPRI
jgi:hypothetical protein